MNPKVSICIPAYKQADYLKKTLVSIFIQNYNNYEIIITDDSPDDSVKNLIKEFNFENKIKYFKNKNHLGTPENWNEAVRQSSGEYIKILHHDDWFKDENSLTEFVKMLDYNPETDFAFSSSFAIGKKNNFLFWHTVTEQQLNLLKKPENLFLGNFIGTPSVTIYRNKIKIKYDKNLKWLVDIDFYIKVLNKNKKFIYSKIPLINVTADGSHQVTQEVENNKCIEIYENFYLYNKIKKTKNIIFICAFLWKIIKSNIFDYTHQEILSCKIKNVPIELKITIKIQKFYRKIRKYEHKKIFRLKKILGCFEK